MNREQPQENEVKKSIDEQLEELQRIDVYKINSAQLLKLRNMLPHGYSKMLQTKIKKSHKKQYATSYIRKALSVNHANNILIIQEAIDLASKLSQKKESIGKRIDEMY